MLKVTQERVDDPSTGETIDLLVTPRSGRGAGARVRNVLLAIWLPIALLIIWWFASATSTSPFFPPLSRIVEEFWAQWIVGDAKLQLASSLRNLAFGYLGGGLIGIVFGTLLWRFPPMRRVSNPVVYFLYVLPAPALLPAMIALFGIGELRQIALISFGAIWPTLLNTLDGMRGIGQVKFDTARAMKLSPARQLFSLVLPGAAPQMAAGLRASLQTAIILMVVTEMVAAKQGIGYFILQAQTVFAITTMWTGILALAIIGTVLNYVFVGVERLVLRWYYRSRALSNS
ncbi:MAG: transporter permease [Cryobacterium sp.]|jgi:sulfonate transport system permease protein|nr:transporter permease [Cryobacterium sp.]